MTKPASPFRFRVTGGGTYDVLDRATGDYLGRVTKGSRYYNIHPRGLWVHYWRAYLPTGGPTSGPLGGTSDPQNFGTRAEAAAALAEAARQPAPD